MTKLLAPLAWGALFGVGLAISGMTQPGKVIGFLDVAGAWDPSLAFVMAGALFVYASLRPLVITRRVARHERVPPGPKNHIDVRLLAGAAIFGAGWGLAGYCPGPAVVSVGSGSLAAAITLGGILGGAWLADATLKVKVSDGPSTTDCAS
jgi:uncharacterized protein